MRVHIRARAGSFTEQTPVSFSVRRNSSVNSGARIVDQVTLASKQAVDRVGQIPRNLVPPQLARDGRDAADRTGLVDSWMNTNTMNRRSPLAVQTSTVKEIRCPNGRVQDVRGTSANSAIAVRAADAAVESRKQPQ